MSNKIKQSLKEEYKKLKKAFDRIISGKKKPAPQPAWQPIRNRRNF